MCEGVRKKAEGWGGEEKRENLSQGEGKREREWISGTKGEQINFS